MVWPRADLCCPGRSRRAKLVATALAFAGFAACKPGRYDFDPPVCEWSYGDTALGDPSLGVQVSWARDRTDTIYLASTDSGAPTAWFILEDVVTCGNSDGNVVLSWESGGDRLEGPYPFYVGPEAALWTSATDSSATGGFFLSLPGWVDCSAELGLPDDPTSWFEPFADALTGLHLHHSGTVGLSANGTGDCTAYDATFDATFTLLSSTTEPVRYK